MVYETIKEICHFSQMQVFATSSYQKKYFQFQIDEAADSLINLFMINKVDLGQMDQLIEQQQILGQQFTEPQPEQPQPEQQQPMQQQPKQSQAEQSPKEQVFTLEELSQNDGGNGRPAYVAVNGIVYDVSNEIRWGGGTHFGLYAGHNLTTEFIGCHNGMFDILDNLIKIGILK